MGRMVQARFLRFIAIPLAIILIASLFSPQIALAPPPAPDHLSLFVLPEDGSDVILDALNDAHESIVFVMYLVSSSDFVDTLKAAKVRGVQVRGMMELNPYGGSSSNIDVFFSKWPEPPDVYYGGKVIRVAGLIEKYRGWSEIIVHDPEEIEIVGDTGQEPGQMPAR